MTSLELQPFVTVFLLKITIGGSFEPSAVVQRTTVFVKDTNVYVKDILLSTDPPLVRHILIFSDPPHNPPKLSFRANGHTKVKVQFSPVV
jgi:hypothetical protein